ncbi:MAG: nucleoside deaminase [Lewinellaceae bacterium]|nr:nucleoside deaminase [Lewinellaceae bacterium]MCB9289854.1 nucleoside deaminase [Lewinellaceae bacterium]
MSDEQFMQEAIRLAIEGVRAGYGGPFGAVVVKGDEIIGRGQNRVLADKDPTAHAEMVAIREACRQLGHFQLDGCVVYASSEPCPMCLGALYWARPSRIVFGSGREDAARISFDDAFIYEELNHHHGRRHIPTTQMMREEALKAFQLWDDKEDKVRY